MTALYPLAWISYLQTGVLIGTLALALFNASKDQIARNFAYAYALFSVVVLVRSHEAPLSHVRLRSASRCMVMLYTSIVSP